MMQDRSETDRSSSAKGRGSDQTATRATPVMDKWSPPSMLELPPDTGEYSYRWIRESVNGMSDSRNVQMRLREGYQRVNISELPENFLMVVDEDLRGDGYCRTGGLILMRFPLEFKKQREKYWRDKRKERAFAVDVLQGVAGANAVQEDRGSRNIDGAEAGKMLQQLNRS